MTYKEKTRTSFYDWKSNPNTGNIPDEIKRKALTYVICTAISHCFPFWQTKTTYNTFFKNIINLREMIQMDRKQIYLVVTSAVVVSLAVASVSASSSYNSPLYRLRMEQASSKMNFLPSAANGFTYTTENGFILNCSVGNCCGKGIVLLGTDATCFPTCLETCPNTCDTCSTCDYTCPATCPVTCSTCYGYTCDATSCQYTCTPVTCQYTCYTCLETCPNTCDTCDPLCGPQP